MTRPALLLAALLALSSPAAAQPEALADEAVAANSDLEAMRARARALEARAEVAGAWPDPMLAVELSNLPVDSFDLSGHPMAGVQLRAQQTLKPPGWSPLQREVGALRADAAGLSVDEAALQLRAAVTRTWWLLTRTRLLREVTEAHLARTEELLRAARVRYETGGVGQHAVLRLTVLRDRLGDELGDFARDERALTAALNEALARPPGQAVPTPAAVEPAPPPGSADWEALARAHRPLVLRLGVEGDAARSAAALARVDARPDLTVWAGYRIRTVETATDPGTDLVAVGLGAPIPAGSLRRARGAEAAAQEEARAAAQALEAVINEIVASVDAALARWGRAAEKTQTCDGVLIPGAQQTLDTTLADFAVGRADFASLFEAEVTLLDLERARIVAAVETHLQQAEVTALLGVEPPGDPE
ncbi:MAG: TolC family protein [Alphaproteobacteria bacterium]|nr:TolC family protein [Alphaproteobacteria bacterium]